MKLVLDGKKHNDEERFVMCFVSNHGSGYAVLRDDDGSLRGVTIAKHRYAAGDYHESISVQKAVDQITAKFAGMLREAEVRGYAAVYIATHGAQVDGDLTVTVDGRIADRYGNTMSTIQDGDTPERITHRVLAEIQGAE